MKNNVVMSEIFVSVILIILLIAFLNPYDFLMPPPFLTMLIILLIALFGVFATMLWKEGVRDERESLHRMVAGRFAFLAGSSVLVVGIITQSLRHTIDSWLIYALVAMILAKIAGLIYSKVKY